MSTPHNSAAKGEIAKTVLMPGDPLRAQFIAENFLTDAKLVNNVRGIHGYTGTYQGVPVSVMASGMGMPSMGIYSHELFAFYDVENIIRIGSAGAMTERLKLRDVVAAQAACTNSNYIAQFGMPGTFAPIADFELLETAVAIAREKGVRMPVGNVLSSDNFYDASGKTMDWAKMGVLCAEMESAALYANAAYLGPEPSHHFRQHRHRRGAARRRPADHLHPDDGDRLGRGRGHGQEGKLIISN